MAEHILKIIVQDEEYDDLHRLAAFNNIGISELLVKSALRSVQKTPGPLRQIFNHAVMTGNKLRMVYENNPDRHEIREVLDEVRGFLDELHKAMEKEKND